MKTTLITGASSGIGEAFARRLAAQGENVLLVARTEDKLASVCNELGRANDISAQYVAMDLAETDAAARLFEETKRRGLEVEMLINNAGFGSMGDFTAFDIERDMKMIDLNIKALVALTHYYLPQMRERKSGTIINVASTAAFQGVPYMAVYAATKAFVLSFSEALWDENRAYNVHVMALCPGVTQTNFFAAANTDKPPMRAMQTPEQVVDTALKGLKRGKSHIVSGWANYLTTETERLVPRWLVARIAGKAMRPKYGENR
ncbi:MAG: NAD(P)-dependent oxidoreductase [Acidobacteria bacterium]|nr:MAG: NAD(P)-dependent oxidoreductase [Acidobacteriota bacterium]